MKEKGLASIEPNRSDQIGDGRLSACLVDVLGESEPAFQARGEANLEHAYNIIREMEGSNVGAMEILHWTREFPKELQSTRG